MVIIHVELSQYDVVQSNCHLHLLVAVLGSQFMRVIFYGIQLRVLVYKFNEVVSQST